jgi:transcriptional regulator with XRE-family HTH domain
MTEGTGPDRMIGKTIGRRILEYRVDQGLTQRALGELAGYSESYVSSIEGGRETLSRRKTLEAFARALRVHPCDLTGTALQVRELAPEHAAVSALRLAVAATEPGDPVDRAAPTWERVRARLDAMNALRPRADYIALGAILPDLILDLHASLDGPDHRAALIGLVDAYSAVQATAKAVGAPDLAQVASRYIRDVTHQLSEPEWSGLAAWSRAQAIAGAARDRAYLVAMDGANELSGHLDTPAVAEVYGSLHLTAALARIASGRTDDAAAHLAEAADIASRPGVGDAEFGHLSFGMGNVGIWATLLAVEAGDGGRGVEIARDIAPASLPQSATRRAAWHIDIGRGLAMERRTRDQAIGSFLTAETLAPQRTHTSSFVREIVTTMLQRTARDKRGRELRGLAYRMGIAR